MTRLYLAAALLACWVPSQATAKEPLVSELCTAQQICVDTVCRPSAMTFRFTYDEPENAAPWARVQMPGQGSADTVFEPTTQGYTWSQAGRVYTLLYLFNVAFEASEPAEFLLVDADAAGRLGAVQIITGTCEASR